MTALCIDLGTTAVKVAVVELASHAKLLHSARRDTHAYQCRDGARAMQDVGAILTALNDCVADIPLKTLASVSRIALCDQMHGVVFWDAANPSCSSALYTWEDRQVPPETLESFNGALSSAAARGDLVSPVFAGYGLPTAAFILSSADAYVSQYTACGTIGTYVVALLMGAKQLSDVGADATDCASMGAFDLGSRAFHTAALQHCAPPALLHMLPHRVLHTGARAGDLDAASCTKLGLNAIARCGSRAAARGSGGVVAVAVHVSMGDHPACMAAAVHSAQQQQRLALGQNIAGEERLSCSCSNIIVVNIGTSAQVAAVGPAVEAWTGSPACDDALLGGSLEIRPFVDTSRMATRAGTAVRDDAAAPAGNPQMLVAASLNGGNVMAQLAERYCDWLGRCRASVAPSLEDTYAILEEAAAAAAATTTDLSQVALGAKSVQALPPLQLEAPLIDAGVVPERAALGWNITAAAPPRAPVSSDSEPGPVASKQLSSVIPIAAIDMEALDTNPGLWWNAAARAVVTNVCDMLPLVVWLSAGCVVSTGGGLTKSGALQRALQQYVSGNCRQGDTAASAGPPAILSLDAGDFSGCVGAALCTLLPSGT